MDGKNYLLVHIPYSELLINSEYIGWICTHQHELYVWPVAYSTKVHNLCFWVGDTNQKIPILSLKVWRYGNEMFMHTKKTSFLPPFIQENHTSIFQFSCPKNWDKVLVFRVNLKSSIMYCFDLKISAELLMSLMRFVVWKLQSHDCLCD